MSDMLRKIAVLTLFATLGCDAAPTPEPAPEPAPGSVGQPAPPPAPASVAVSEKKEILFLGTSLTAGYGIGAGLAFPAVIQQKIDSAGLPFRVRNAGLSGETSAGGLRRIEWSLQQPVDVLVLELGANDGLRGLSVERMRANLDTIIVKTKRRYPDAAIVIAGMEAPPNLGALYTTRFRETYRELANTHDAVLIPFLLEGVAADAGSNQEDGIHPNVAGHRRIAENVWRVLLPILEQRVRQK